MPSPRGKRSPYSEAKSYIYEVSYRDYVLAETVFNHESEVVLDHVVEVYQPETAEDYERLRRCLPEVVTGEVIADSLGRGSFQT